MGTNSKYDVNPNRLKGQKDIVSHVLELMERVGTQETASQAGHTSVEDGNFTVRNGDIIVSESDDTIVLRILHGAFPEVRMFPLGEIDTHRIALYGIDDTATGQAAIFAVEINPGGAYDGGNLIIAKNYLWLSHLPDSGEETAIVLNADPTSVTPEIINMRGRWYDQIQIDSHQAIYAGAFTASAGVSTWTHTYFTPFATTTVPVFTIGVSGGTLTWGIDAYSTSSFTVRFGVTGNSKFVTFWNFRI